MPQIFAKTLLGLSVETESGTHIGKVVDVALDVDAHTVVSYAVIAGNVVRQLLQDAEIITIAPSQVVAITAQKMVVSDLVSRESAVAPQLAA